MFRKKARFRIEMKMTRKEICERIEMTIAAAAASSSTFVFVRRPVLIVALSPFRIAKHFVSLVDLDEFFLRFRALILVRMPFLRQLLISPFDFGGRSCSTDSQNGVWVERLRRGENDKEK